MREIIDVTIFGGFTLINHKLAPVTALVSHVHKRKPPAGITWTIILFNLAHANHLSLTFVDTRR